MFKVRVVESLNLTSMAELRIKSRLVAFDGAHCETSLSVLEGDQRVALSRFASALFPDVSCNLRIDVVSYGDDGKEVSVVTPVELIHSIC